jgi:ParB family chromosome partitioning protein
MEDLEVYKIRKTPVSYRSISSDDTSILTNSILQKGLLQPIIVRPLHSHDDDDYHYEIVAGNRRYDACRALGWRKVICQVIDLDDKDAFEVSLTENIQRKSLNPLEEANAFRMYVKDYGWGGISELAKSIGRSISYVDKRLALLDLPLDIVEKLQQAEINASVAEELISIRDLDAQHELAKIATEQKLSSRRVRNLVKDWKCNDDSPNTSNNYSNHGDLDYRNSTFGIEMFHNKKPTPDEAIDRTFDRVITVLKITMNKLAYIIESIEDNWFVYETLMQHKNMLNSQIDVLIKEKKKLNYK